MHEFSLQYLRCVRCGSKLDCDVFSEYSEIIEGLLQCKKCDLHFPIIEKIPVLWDDFSTYLSSRTVLAGKLYRTIKNERLKQFLKKSLLKTKKTDDRTTLEEKWSKIYQQSRNSKFYSVIKHELKQIPRSDLVLEYGCSVGFMTHFLANRHEVVFGVDRSFSAISVAKKSNKNNLDYFVADSLSDVFGKTNFDLILALNVLELIEPVKLLQHASRHIKRGFFVISDPYDFDRGINSVKHPLNETSLRQNLEKLGFSITLKTKKPSFHSWNLKINPRTTLNYKVDVIIGKK
ncbi:methyltransferase domain-containing protein [Nitrosopumilus sp. K4]|uniref:methyltransferase domain-containing protein n=1 Tax=Nitrosopumilus sp. K4 TaxID=2795383 RepID=UPI001BA8E3E7|nr:methyltransferase domain-containing protein [Nitrosopumilus sp. K4]QUC64964.1 methyltransferase domain-containing protein [Nitrosopumilus sp. K4]